ncbi:MAG: hypothetical protein GY714_30670 [Desulfobacterales bacterium]|nr:hypothetical protein [Desulfobacterales bacterium]
MFEYYQGFEIDGSDTSYNIITPEAEKIREVVNYYLNLKIIDKNEHIQIYSCNGKRKHHLSGKKYQRGELDRLWEDLEGVNSFELKYQYMAPSSLYPEVKREIIDFIIKKTKIDEKKLVNPTLGSNFYNGSYLKVVLNTQKAKDSSDSIDTICNEDYFKKIYSGDFVSLEIDYTLGASFAIKYYGFKKLKERFPELSLDEEAMLYVPWYDISLKNLIYEQITIEANDYLSTVDRIMKLAEIKELKLRNERILGQDYSKVYYELDDQEERFKHITGIYRSCFDGTPIGYIAFAERLASSGLCKGKDFEDNTSFTLWFKKGSKEEFSGGFNFIKTNQNLKLVFEVQWNNREIAQRFLNI